MDNIPTDRDLDEYVERLHHPPERAETFTPILTFRRRTVLRYLSLCEPESVVPVHELARVCAAVERSIHIGSITSTEYAPVRQGLKDRDVPLLATHDVVEVVGDTDVQRGQRFGYYDALLDVVDSFVRTRHEE